MPHLRSLYIPHIADHPHGVNIDMHELALQIVDIVTLRPDIELCYMGLGGKCFEILENRVPVTAPHAGGARNNDNDGRGGVERASSNPRHGAVRRTTMADHDAEDDALLSDTSSTLDDSDDMDEWIGASTNDDADLDTNSDSANLTDTDEFDREDDISDWDDDSFGGSRRKDKGKGKKKMRLRLQEILFYDKVSIFKARYGRL